MELHGGPVKRKRRKPPDQLWVQFMSDDEKEKDRIEQCQTISLSDVGLPVRVANTLENYGLLTIGDLAKLTVEDLESIQNLGEVTIARCTKLLNEMQIPHQLKERKT
jgi:DNA-directed RNA polymerase alpha subunit